jgi:hypothetical protein
VQLAEDGVIVGVTGAVTVHVQFTVPADEPAGVKMTVPAVPPAGANTVPAPELNVNVITPLATATLP